ncbi:MAG TPA: glutamyl-tRNA reductase [Gemmatimonadaceae bacterium]|jgi:glutamyl-tRNA reductase|nr:glutamyl-tRNA reductase [Gemmatimonadaceae bacterium]
MALIVAGMSHHTAPIDARERCAVDPQDVGAVLDAFRAASNAREAVLLSTCNRTEFYVVENDTEAADSVWTTLSARLGDDATPLGYVRRDRDAVRHLMRVTAGLDAMVLGEAQIQGQVRDAWELSRGRSGPVLNRLFQTSLSVAGRVRTETAIGRGSASVSSAAVQLAKKIFGTLHGRRAMILGAGQMAELALECLIDEGVRAALVANRTFERAEALARRHGATAIRYDDCWDDLATVDLLLCSTSAPHPVVHPHHLTPRLAARGGRPLCILDIALPRDVEPAVAALDNVFLYDLDDLRAVVAANIEQRRSQLPSAEQLIDGEVERFWQWLAGLAAVPVVTEVRSAMERMRAEELAQALRRLGDLTPAQRDAVEQLSRSLMNKFLHEPSVRLRAAAANGRGLGIVDAARYLFAVDDGGET